MAEETADVEIDEELLEFLEADLLPEAAHPQFKTQLREYLRGILRAEGVLPARPGEPPPVPPVGPLSKKQHRER